MPKVVKGSAHYADDNTMVFIPYSQGRPENITWMPLCSSAIGKIECSKKKVRMVLTMDRQDMNHIYTRMLACAGQMLAQFLSDKKVKKLFDRTAELLPHEIRQEDNKQDHKADANDFPFYP